MKRVAVIAAALLVAGCGGGERPEPRIVTQVVDRPVPVACVPTNLGPAPAYPDTDEALLRATPEGRYSLLIAGRELRKSRLGEVEPVIEECRK